MGNLNGKIAIVTGAARQRGIGHSICLHLAQRGADIVVVSRPWSPSRIAEARKEGWEGIRSVVKEVEALGVQGLAIDVDVTSEQQLEDMTEKCIDRFGKIDILVNNAGTPGPVGAKLVDLPEETWDEVIKINLKGAFLCSKVVVKRMIARGEGGKIINVASYMGKMAVVGWSMYSISKFGLLGLTQNLALELGRHKIYVNAVCPGGVATELTDKWIVREIERGTKKGLSVEEATAKAHAVLDSLVPLGRIAQPEDVAKVVAFLASPDSDYMTGQAINVTGGQLMCH